MCFIGDLVCYLILLGCLLGFVCGVGDLVVLLTWMDLWFAIVSGGFVDGWRELCLLFGSVARRLVCGCLVSGAF